MNQEFLGQYKPHICKRGRRWYVFQNGHFNGSGATVRQAWNMFHIVNKLVVPS